MYWLRLLIATDQWFNTLLGGMPDETISAKLWRNRDRQPYKTLQIIVDRVFWFDPEHCKSSYMSELHGKYLPTEYVKEKK